MAKIIHTDGTETQLDLPAGDGAQLKCIQDTVGGYFEQIRLPAGCGYDYMLLNEEGLLMRLPPNDKATQLIRELGGKLSTPIVGNVILVSASEIE